MATDTGRMQVKMEVDMTDIEVGILQTVWLQASRKALREPHASALEDFATPSEASLFLPRELTRNSCCDLEVPPITSSRPSQLIPRPKVTLNYQGDNFLNPLNWCLLAS